MDEKPQDGITRIITAESRMKLLQPSQWKCYMFGNTPEIDIGFTYQPAEGNVPNWFVRWMMRICFACTWVKDISR